VDFLEPLKKTPNKTQHTHSHKKENCSVINNAKSVLDKRYDSVLRKMHEENPKLFKERSAIDLTDGIVENKLETYSRFIRNRLGTVK